MISSFVSSLGLRFLGENIGVFGQLRQPSTLPYPSTVNLPWRGSVAVTLLAQKYAVSSGRIPKCTSFMRQTRMSC
jgi:hypothetical protein